ncbi:MAG: 3-oxoacid CoA-transferase subunit B [Bacteroidales bacterium]|nr:3-oxoacid CoA-transferase subunit B [Bacteroidales bacterium]
MELKENSGWSINEMAQKAAQDIHDGAYVNLGIGIPELVADYIPEGREVIYHTENGLLGMGKVTEKGSEDYELVNAGKKYVTAIPGASYFHHADSFAMIRGGHIDICVLGAYQVSEEGDIANWSTGDPNDVPAVGGAMDLVAGVKTIYVITQHCTKSGEPKIVRQCTYPLTGKKVVNKIYTNYAVIDVTEDGLVVKELAPGITFEFLQQNTGAPLLLKQ